MNTADNLPLEDIELPEFGELPSDKMLRIIAEKIPQDVDMSEWESL